MESSWSSEISKHPQTLFIFENEHHKEECTICYDNFINFKECIYCKQKWCKNCDNNIFECPYCRHVITGREENLRKRKRDNLLWQTDDAIYIDFNDGLRDNNFENRFNRLREDFVRLFITSIFRTD